MTRAFWTWNPVCSGEFRRFDEPYMLHHNAWLFDRQVWTDMFRATAEQGFNAMVFANTHPFPFMIGYDRFREARMLDDTELEQYRAAYTWVFQEGRRHGIDTYLLFFSVYYPEPMLDHMGVHDRAAYAASDLAIDYTRYCVTRTITDYPDLAGVIGEASENIHGSRGVFLRESVVEPFERLAAGKKLIIRGWCSDSDEFRREICERTRVPITFSVKYTWEHLVHANPDPLFTDWTDAAGPGSVMAELWISNFEPFTCFGLSTARGIVDNLRRLGCAGFSIHPLSMYEWPLTSDRCWRYQFDRDALWYAAWGGSKELPPEHEAMMQDGRLIEGLEAASEILKVSAVYFAGDRQNQWHPQFCSVRHPDGVRLLTIEDMCSLRSQSSQWGAGIWDAFDKLDWRTTFTGRPTMHFEDYDPSNTTAYGPVEFAQEMDELSCKALSAISSAEGRYGSDTQQCLLRHGRAQALLGRFWAERARAGLAYVSRDNARVVKHMENALGFIREIEAVEGSHRDGFRVLTGRCAQANNWDMPRAALEQELSDYRAGRSGGRYYAGRLEHRDTSTHPRGEFVWRKR